MYVKCGKRERVCVLLPISRTKDFVYEKILSLRLSNQALWLRDKTVMLVLVAGATSSWTYVVTLGCSSSMAGHLATNQGSSLVWQMGGAALSIILLAHL
jgi:hypothetical protein